jgi:hypothetical protein
VGSTTPVRSDAAARGEGGLLNRQLGTDAERSARNWVEWSVA